MSKEWLKNKENDVYYLTAPKTDFEQLYVKVRDHENRIHDDEFVKQLPNTPATHPHHKEWNIRRWTLNKILKHLENKSIDNLLEIGCGNGWLTHHMSEFSKNTYGLDIGKLELEQAARCFGTENTHFVCCSELELLPKEHFDVIVFSASIQYFQLDATLWNVLKSLLTPQGEIHLIDSPFYKKEEIDQAKLRSRFYFESIDCAEASVYYQHLTWDALPSGFKLHYAPNRLLRKINPNQSPFPWIIIEK